jgi:hypothetical protein
MPHWGLQMDGPNKLLNAVATALRGAFHAGDADRLLAIGRTLGLLRRLAFDEPEFLLRLQESQHALENAVGQVLADAQSDAGDELVDPEVLLTLTKALAAAFDLHDGTGS